MTGIIPKGDTWAARAARLEVYFRDKSLDMPSKEAWMCDALARGVACSGGADSLALLLLLWARFPGWRASLQVLHMNHGLRGKESEADEAFVAEVARSLNLPICVGRGKASGGTSPSEATLRDERLAFFCECGVRVVLQGHHRDDVLETMLMRLCRGSGTEGLSAPVPWRAMGSDLYLSRPLLTWGREEIRQGLKSSGIPWREDGSNAGEDYFRNRIRQRVVPALVAASRDHDPTSGALRARALLEEDAEALAAWADKLVEKLPSGQSAWTLPEGLPKAVYRRLFWAWLRVHGLGEVTPAVADLVVDALGTGGTVKVSVGVGGYVQVHNRILDWRAVGQGVGQPRGDAVLVPGSLVSVPGGGVLQAVCIPLDEELRARILGGEVDAATTAFLAWDNPASPSGLCVRFRRPGDRYHALGAPGSRKVKDMMIDTKVPPEERNGIPLVCTLGPDGDSPVWIPGFPPAERWRLGPDTRWALRLTWRSSGEMI